APVSIPPEGRVIGHEGVGRVVGAGAGVRHVRPGDIVAFASIEACMQCDVCRRGAFNQCPSARLLGMQSDGLFGTVVDVPAVLAHDVSALIRDDADLRAAACLEPAGVALLACENARMAPGDRVAIFGAGPIGLYCAMLAKRVFGASHVSVVEPLAGRRQWAAPWCDDACDPETYFAARHDPVDVVIEGSGELGNVNRIFPAIGPNGRVVLLGRSGMPLTIDAIDHMITQAISVMGSRGHLGGPLPRVLALYRAGLLPLGAVVSGVLGSLDELLDSLARPDELAERHCKLLARIDAGAPTDFTNPSRIGHLP
ncbi:MAG: alcohol dehydrogenase catalytic domain-containing protein, partial [Thiobacillus sp.]|nr:alcohol dehydrogenase catalytic domain-containing protein [Thiobacillus sp.]